MYNENSNSCRPFMLSFGILVLGGFLIYIV